MSGTTTEKTPEMVSMTVAPGKTIYTRGHSAPFRAGETIEVDAATAAELETQGNAARKAPPIAAPAAEVAEHPAEHAG